MRLPIIVIYIKLSFVLLVCSCEERNSQLPTASELAFYTDHSSFTEPANYLYLYDSLNSSLQEVCNLIKKQLIHPQEAREMKDLLPDGRFYEDPDFPLVSQMLAELITRDSNGLVMDRSPENRLVVACYHHSLLLASIMRSKGIPVRTRAGFARYFEKELGVRFGHIICEVWNNERQRWILIDPDRNMVDFSERKFEYSFDAWRNLRKENKDDVKYIAALSEDEHAILHILIQDLSSVVREEKSYWDEPVFLRNTVHNINQLPANQLHLFDTIAELLSEPDNNLGVLRKLYAKNEILQPTALKFSAWYYLRTGKEVSELQKTYK